LEKKRAKYKTDFTSRAMHDSCEVQRRSEKNLGGKSFVTPGEELSVGGLASLQVSFWKKRAKYKTNLAN